MDTLAVASVYFDAGWHPLWLPAGAKKPPPDGRTGGEGVDMRRTEVEATVWNGNIAVRMPVDVLGLDVDVYHRGDRTLDDLLARCGPLPNTHISHSGRNDGSGIRFYRVPNGLSWIASLPGIEIIQRHHRYAVVWPSVHPDGRTYGWWDQAEGAPLEGVPAVDDLPDLPWTWVAELSRASAGDVEGMTRACAANADEVRAFVDLHGAADAPGYITTIVAHFAERHAAGYSRHDTMQHCLIWALECCGAGIAPAGDTLGALAEVWTAAVAPDARRMELYAERRVTEFDAMVRHAVGKVNARTEAELFKIHDDIAGIPMNVPPPATNGAGPPVEPPTALPTRRITLTPASAIKPRPVKWLWTGRVALGSLALVGGREGIGKSLVTYQLVADITRGLLPGLSFGVARAVMVCATEDSWEHTIVPRLMASGADLDRVFRIDVVTYEGTAGTLSLPVDLAALEAAVAEVGAASIVLDPLLSRLSAQLDTHKDAEVRLALEPLVALADRTGTAVLGLIHVNKATTTDPLTMLMASRAFAAVARAVLFVAVDPEDEAAQRRFIGQPKNNLGTVDLPLLTFTIGSALVATTEEGEIWTGVVEWQGEDPRSIADVLRTGAERAAKPHDRTDEDEAADWLRLYLQTHPIARSDRVKEAAKGDHKEHTLKRARQAMGVGLTNRDFPRRTWWSRPGLSPEVVAAWLDIHSEHDDCSDCEGP